MGYKYSIEKIQTNWGEQLIIMKLPNELSAAASFISNITKDMGKWYLEGFEKVLSGEEEYQERNGEFLGSQIRKDFTQINDMFSGQYESCKLETVELKKLIDIWLKELVKNLNV